MGHLIKISRLLDFSSCLTDYCLEYSQKRLLLEIFLNKEDLIVEDLKLSFAPYLDCFKGLAGKNVFLTGATGFFGAWLVRSVAHLNSMLSAPIHLTVLVRDKAAAIEKFPERIKNNIKFVQGDLVALANISSPTDLFIHAAVGGSAEISPGRDSLLLNNIVGGTESALKFCILNQCKKFLLISSGGVYGNVPQAQSPVLESYCGVEPSMVGGYRSMYSIGKRAAENLMVAYGQGFNIDVISARCFAFVGPMMPLNKNFAIGNFISDVIAGRDITINGDGTPVRSYMYMSDLAAALWYLLVKGQSFQAYNVGSDRPITILGLAELIKAELKTNVKIIVQERSVATNPVNEYLPSIKKISDLGFKARVVSLEDAIRKTAFWSQR